MGQKTNPIALRLRYSNLDFENTWYSQNHYAQCLIQNLQLKQYTKDFSKHLNVPENRLAVNFNFRNNKLYTFYCFPIMTRFPRARQFKVVTRLPRFWNHLRIKQIKYINRFKFAQKNKYNRIQNYKLSANKIERLVNNQSSFRQRYFFSKQKGNNPIITNQQMSNIPQLLRGIKTDFHLNYLLKDIQKLQNHLTFHKTQNFQFNINNYQISKLKLRYLLLSYFFELQKGKIYNQLPFQNIYKQAISFIPKLNINNNHKTSKKQKISTVSNIYYPFYLKTPENRNYQNFVTNYISTQYNLPFHYYSFLMKQDLQHAGFLADEIVYFLERRVPFKRIKNKIARELNNISWIQGIRLEFSGRVSSRSKKAQRAKHELVKLGQTSLHVFDYKMDYAARTAMTSYGSVGIKVWICYK